MNIEWCPTCGKIKWEKHRCLPIFVLSCEEYGIDEAEARGRDAEDAAKNFADEWDSDDYILAKGGSMTLVVKDQDGNTSTFVVTCRLERTYQAVEKVS